MVELPYSSPMGIKGITIAHSDKFDWDDYPAMRVKKMKIKDGKKKET